MPRGVFERTEEYIEKLSNAHKGNHLSEITKKKIGETHKGMYLSEEIREKISESVKVLWQNFEYRKHMSEAHKGQSNFWKGGISKQKGYRSFMEIRRKIRKHNNGGSHTLWDWENLKAQYNWTCPSCGKSEPEITLTEDHIIPISKGGSDNIENIQPLCGSCNCKKRTKIIRYDIFEVNKEEINVSN